MRIVLGRRSVRAVLIRNAEVGRGDTSVSGGSIHRGLECRWNMSFKNSDQSGSLFFIIKNMYIMVPDHYPDLAQSTAQK